ncbi:hypothetical protein, partial [Yersinia frederiksenii]|uniref:hypothetical protein n=1 Tax=Yersinia frederiksenii TaxID=29484 RepID=UPI001C95B280
TPLLQVISWILGLVLGCVSFFIKSSLILFLYFVQVVIFVRRSNKMGNITRITYLSFRIHLHLLA